MPRKPYLVIGVVALRQLLEHRGAVGLFAGVAGVAGRCFCEQPKEPAHEKKR